VLFLGDSSLGNAIDVSLCEQEYGIHCTSLALTGVFGYAGSLGMLERALEKSRPKVVVLMQTLNMMARPVSDKAYGLVSPLPLAVLSLPFEDACAALWNFDFIVSAVKVGFVPDKPSSALVGRDYIPQGDRLFAGDAQLPQVPEWGVAEVNIEKIKYLQKIVQLCESNSIPLVYAHGPLAEHQFHASRSFQKAAEMEIKKTGITILADTPFVMPLNEVGDSDDHVAPALRAVYTRRYLDKLLKCFADMGLAIKP
jgi:hypothetical protein